MARVFPFPFHPDLEVGPAPIGEPCTRCQRTIALDELGFLLPHHDDAGPVGERPVHRICLLRSAGMAEALLDHEREIERNMIKNWHAAHVWEPFPPAPFFLRHCPRCTPLGRYRWHGGMDFDLYHCADHHPRNRTDTMPTVVARFGSEDEQEFLSADIARALFAGQPNSPSATALAEALKRAMRLGLPLVPEDLEPGGPP